MKYLHTLPIGLLATLIIGCSEKAKLPGGSGMLEAEESIVSAQTVGEVQTTAVVEGAQFKIGDTLLTIDPTDLQLKLDAALASREAANAKLEVARVNLDRADESAKYAASERDRISRLVTSGTATSQRLDQLTHEANQADILQRAAKANISAIRADIESLDAQIAQIKKQLSDCYPTAPVPGIVTEKYIDLGELLAPGKPIAKISRLDTLWVKVYLPTPEFSQVKVGDKAIIDTESGDKKYDGWVIWTAQSAEFTPKNVQTEKSRTNLVYAVKVRVPNTDGSLKIGMPVYVTLEQQ